MNQNQWLVLAGIIVVLAGGAGALFWREISSRTSTAQPRPAATLATADLITDEERRRRDIQRKNADTAFAAFQKAQQAGQAYVSGKAAEADDEALFGPFRDDPRVWNVLYERARKDPQRGVVRDRKFMRQDRLRFALAGPAEGREGAEISSGRTARGEPATVVRKAYSAPEDEAVYLWGEITVIVLAEEEEPEKQAPAAGTPAP